MSYHPECRENEIFVGNTSSDLSELAVFKTARFGKVAYTIDGEKLEPSLGVKALIIGRSELAAYDHMMMVKTFGPNYR